jgi:hypothetical protein
MDVINHACIDLTTVSNNSARHHIFLSGLQHHDRSIMEKQNHQSYLPGAPLTESI